MLYFFFNEEALESYPPAHESWHVLHYDGDTAHLQRRLASSEEQFIYPTCAVEFSTILTLPPLESLYLERLGLSYDAYRPEASREQKREVDASDGAWISYEMLDTMPLTIPEHRLLLERWFATTRVPLTEGLPWTRDGWFEEASAWLQDQLQRHGLVATGHVEQTRSWFISSILRIPTTAGDVYFKAVPLMDVHEPLLTQMVAAQFPTLVPQVLAVHEENR